MIKILRIIDSITPKTGGPIAGIQSMTPYLDAQCVQTTICSFSSNHSQLPDSVQVIPYPNNGITTWNFTRAIDRTLTQEIAQADLVIIHGLWKYQSIPARRLCKELHTPYFVYCHGMLDPWFNETYPFKRIKKQLTWRLNEAPLLRDATATIFTSLKEAELAQKSFSPYQTKSIVLPYGIEPITGINSEQSTLFRSRYQLSAKPFFLYLGRLHEKKNVLRTIQAFIDSQAYRTHDLVLAGAANQTSYANQLDRFIAEQKPVIQDSIRRTGPLYGEDKACAYRLADAFVLFSHQENFGLTIAESLSASCPVLISDRVNISDTIRDGSCGIVSTDQLADMTTTFTHWIKMNDLQKSQLRQNTTSVFNKNFHIQTAARALYSLILKTI